MQKLCLSTKILHQDIMWNYGIFRSEITFLCKQKITRFFNIATLEETLYKIDPAEKPDNLIDLTDRAY